MHDPGIRLASASDAEAIATLYAQGAAAWVVPRTALGCEGAAAYVQALVEQRGPGWSSQFWVADDDAFVQLRRIDPRTVMINNIFVDARARGRGLGTELLWRSLGEHPQFERVVLDVFDDNDSAHAWYRALGFSFTSSRVWLEREQPTDVAGEYQVEGLPQADVVHRAFGFSMVHVETPRGTHAVGRLGARWFRIPAPSALDDPGLVAALAELGPHRRVLAMASAIDDRQPWTSLGSAQRGQAQRTAVLAALHSRRRNDAR